MNHVPKYSKAFVISQRSLKSLNNEMGNAIESGWQPVPETFQKLGPDQFVIMIVKYEERYEGSI